MIIKKNKEGYKDHFLVRLGKKGYRKFRRLLIDLSEKYYIRNYYVYEEIRSFIYDSPVSIIA